MRSLLAALALVAATAARADLALAPGEPFTADAARRLLLPHAGAGRELEVLAPALPLNNRSTRPVHLAVASFQAAGADGFTADVLVTVADGTTNTLRLSGRAAEMTEVPVPSESVAAGTILAAGQVATARVALAAVPPDAVTTLAALVGAEAVRRLPPGRPVRQADLRAPLMVRRGETVTLVLESGPLRLTALGRALENGGRDAAVRVLNLDSRREIRGIVVGRKRVAVGPVP